MRTGKRAAVFLLCAGLLCGCAPQTKPDISSAPAVRMLSFQVSSNLPPAVLEQADAFADRVMKLSGGLLLIDVTTGLADHESVKNGTVDFAFLSNIQLAQLDERFSMLHLPFLYDDYRHMSMALNSDEVLEILGERLAPQNIVPLVAVYRGSNSLVTTRKEVRQPSDFKDLVIAMHTENAEKLTVFEALSAQVLPYSQTSLMPALGTTVEILPEDLRLPSENVVVDTIEMGIEDVSKLTQDPNKLYLIYSYHTLSPLWLAANAESISQLTTFERAILDEACAGLLSGLERLRIERETNLTEQLRAQGVTIVDIERPSIAAAVYGLDGKGTERYVLPAYFDNRLYRIIQNYA